MRLQSFAAVAMILAAQLGVSANTAVNAETTPTAVFSTVGVYPFTPRYDFREGRPLAIGSVGSEGGENIVDVKLGNNLVWTGDKIGRVHEQVLALKLKAPGLLKLACVRAPIKIYFFEQLTLPSGADCHLFAKRDCLLVARKFFDAPKATQQHLFNRAMMELADTDGIISLNNTWTNIANSYLDASKKDYSEPGGSERFPRYDGGDVSKCLSESLAEYVADYIDGKTYPSKKLFDDGVAPLIFTPDKNEVEWCQLVAAAREKVAAGAFEDATIKLERTSVLLPEQPMPYFYLAYTAARGANLAATLTNVQELIDKFAALNMPAADHTEFICLKKIVRVFVEAKRFDDAVILLEPLCAKFPKETWFAEQRDFCKAHKG